MAVVLLLFLSADLEKKKKNEKAMRFHEYVIPAGERLCCISSCGTQKGNQRGLFRAMTWHARKYVMMFL